MTITPMIMLHYVRLSLQQTGARKALQLALKEQNNHVMNHEEHALEGASGCTFSCFTLVQGFSVSVLQTLQAGECVWGAVLCIVEALAASLASTT